MLKYWELAVNDGKPNPFIENDKYIELYPGNPYENINVKELISWARNWIIKYDRVPIESVNLYRYFSKDKIFNYEDLNVQRQLFFPCGPCYPIGGLGKIPPVKGKYRSVALVIWFMLFVIRLFQMFNRPVQIQLTVPNHPFQFFGFRFYGYVFFVTCTPGHIYPSKGQIRQFYKQRGNRI